MRPRISNAGILRKGDDDPPSGLAEMIRRLLARFFSRFDLLQIIPLVLLLTIGLFFVYGTGQQVGGSHAELFQRQAAYLGLGAAIWLFLVFFDYRWLGPLSLVIYPAVLFLLIYVLKFGVMRNQARRWIEVAGVSLQPSELGKLAVLLATSWILANVFRGKNATKRDWLMLGLAGLLAVVPFVLILKEPDLGTALILPPMFAAIVFVTEIKWRYLIIGFLAIAIIGGVSAPVMFKHLKPYQKERILTFLDRDRDPLNRGWNANQAEIAVGTGGFWGKGYMNGKHCPLGYLPQVVSNSDFIFPVYAEETGFVGSFVLLFLYALMLYSIFRTAMVSPDPFGRCLCIGIASILLSHIVINIGMCIRLLPVTGLPLPFISYGGTFLVAMMIYLGIVQSVYAHRKEKPVFADLDEY